MKNSKSKWYETKNYAYDSGLYKDEDPQRVRRLSSKWMSLCLIINGFLMVFIPGFIPNLYLFIPNLLFYTLLSPFW